MFRESRVGLGKTVEANLRSRIGNQIWLQCQIGEKTLGSEKRGPCKNKRNKKINRKRKHLKSACVGNFTTRQGIDDHPDSIGGGFGCDKGTRTQYLTTFLGGSVPLTYVSQLSNLQI